MTPINVTLVDGSIRDLWRLEEADIKVEHVVHTLSQMPRWGARTTVPYSVLQHSLFMVQLVPQKHRLQAISHDFPEAYLPDIPSTLKAQMPWYQQLEDTIWDVMLPTLDLEPVEQIVWDADISIRDIERCRLFPNQRKLSRPHSYLEFILGLSPADVRAVFWEKWREL